MHDEQPHDWLPGDFEVDLSSLTVADVVTIGAMGSNPALILNVLSIMDKCVKGGVSGLPADAMEPAMTAFAIALKAKFPKQAETARNSRVLNGLLKGLRLRHSHA